MVARAMATCSAPTGASGTAGWRSGIAALGQPTVEGRPRPTALERPWAATTIRPGDRPRSSSEKRDSQRSMATKRPDATMRPNPEHQCPGPIEVPAATAWVIAPSASPWASNHSLARRWIVVGGGISSFQFGS